MTPGPLGPDERADRAQRADELAATARKRGRATAERERQAHREAEAAKTEGLRQMHEREAEAHKRAVQAQERSVELQERHAEHERAAGREDPPD